MKIFRGILLIASLLLSQLALAQQDTELTEEGLNTYVVAPLNLTNDLIKKDIDDTKIQIQKLSDVQAQDDAIRGLLLRTVGRMTSYANLGYNLHSVDSDFQSYLIPYFLIDARDKVSEETPWFELMKDSSKFPQFNSPLLLIDTIKKNFSILESDTEEMSGDIRKKINKNSQQAPNQTAPLKEIPPNLTKYLLKHHKSPLQAI